MHEERFSSGIKRRSAIYTAESTREILVHGRIVLSFFDGSREQFAHGIAFTQIAPTDQSAIEDHIHEL
ncbi:MAG: hypothetical protein M3Y18_00265 [Candidatus Eremiobacteraeota bacterium]|nr:hypothetical protein [Candidatus Eremiobacteraeota bacterium]